MLYSETKYCFSYLQESAYEIDLLYVIPRFSLQCKLRTLVFWDVMLHCWASGSPRFKGTY
jgi:hypothetical protein